MWWNSVVKLWEYQCRSVFRCEKRRQGCALMVASVQGIARIIVGSEWGTYYEEKWGDKN
jgi:hypothetical protein